MPFLTPSIDALNAPLLCRTIEASGELFLFISGALAELEKEYNWEQFGTATPEQMADYFKDINDLYIESTCGGSGMTPISGVTHQLWSDPTIEANGETFTVDFSDLPPSAGDARAIYVNLILFSSNGGNAFIQITDDQDALQTAFPVTGQITMVPLVCPISNGQVNFECFPNGGQMNATCNLIGWW